MATVRLPKIPSAVTRLLLILALLAATAGCTPTVRSTGDLPYPRDGIYLLYSRQGRLIEKTVWRQGALVAAWQYERPTDLPRDVVDAVNRGEREWPAPRWIQVVKRGTGVLTYLDKDGHDFGFAVYLEGRYVRGAH